MADFKTALAITLKSEGGFFHVIETGEVVNMGITLETLRNLGVLKSSGPATDADIAFVKSLTLDEVTEIYEKEYWCNIGEISSQTVANKVFDVQVNTGHGVIFLQLALGVQDDGILGPRTAAATNEADPQKLLAIIKLEGTAYYKNLATKKDIWAKDLNGWLARLNA